MCPHVHVTILLKCFKVVSVAIAVLLTIVTVIVVSPPSLPHHM